MSKDATPIDTRRAAMGSTNRLKLGLFGANCSSGRAVTMVPERWSGSWLDCLRLARMADRAGIELTAGREAKGYKRLPPERRAKVIEARRANPDAPQEHDCAVGWCEPVHSLADRTRSS